MRVGEIAIERDAILEVPDELLRHGVHVLRQPRIHELLAGFDALDLCRPHPPTPLRNRSAALGVITSSSAASVTPSASLGVSRPKRCHAAGSSGSALRSARSARSRQAPSAKAPATAAR